MSVNNVSTTQVNDVYSNYNSTAAKNDTKSEAAKVEDTAAVYDKSDSTAKKATYSVNKMSAQDREALVKQLKADQASRQQSLVSLVHNMMGGQAKTSAIANGDKDGIWKFLASGDYTVDAATKKQAQEDISEDGYWGVKQTSQRLFDFASALAGDDVDKMKEMQAAVEKGYKLATKAWGKELPQISKDTFDATNKLFDEYYKSKEV